MPTIKYQGRNRRQYRNEQDAYREEKLALDYLELNIAQEDKGKKDFLTSQSESYGGLASQVADGNITRKEIKDIKGSLNLLDKQFENSKYTDDVVISSSTNKFKTMINESLEIAEDNLNWREDKQGIVTALGNIPKYDEESGKYNVQAIAETLENISNLKEYYSGQDEAKYKVLKEFEKVGVQRNVVQSELQRYTDNPIDEKINPTKAAAFREAKVARAQGDWGRAYTLLTGSALSDVTDKEAIDKANVKTMAQIEKEYNDAARKSFVQHTRTKDNKSVTKQRLGGMYQFHSQYADYPTNAGDFNLNPTEIDRRFRIMVDGIIDFDNIGGTIIGGNALKQHKSAFKDDMPSYAALMSGMIMKGEGKGNYNYADGTPYMEAGKVLEGRAIGDYDMPMSETIESTMRNNVGNIKYDTRDGGDNAAIQDAFAGNSMSYITTLPQWLDNEWVKPTQTPEEASRTLKEAQTLRKEEVDTANKNIGNSQSKVNSWKKQKENLIAKVRKSKKGYEDTEQYDDERIQSINKSSGGASKMFRELNKKIKLEEEKIKDLKKLLGDDISEEYNDTAEARDIVDSIKPLSLT